MRREQFDVVVLDPPRQGCPDAVSTGLRGSARRIVYVSCNPERLAVERARLERGGYRLSRLQGVDMFPHTDHIEAVAVFEPASRPTWHNTPAEPRPASTVVVLRPGATAAFEVLLVRRNDRVAFMAGAYVFPGGRVDEADPSGARTPRFWVEPPRFTDLTTADEWRYRAAAVRELTEEADVRVGVDDLVPIAHWVTPRDRDSPLRHPLLPDADARRSGGAARRRRDDGAGVADADRRDGSMPARRDHAAATDVDHAAAARAACTRCRTSLAWAGTTPWCGCEPGFVKSARVAC